MFLRGMLILGLLALIAALVMVWRADHSIDMGPQTTTSTSPGKPVGTSTLSHGGPSPTANPNGSRDAVSH